MSDLIARTDALGADLVAPLAPATAARILDVGRTAVLATVTAVAVQAQDYANPAAVIITAGEG